MEEMTEKIWAFWEYDRYPYLLSGPVKRITDEGYATVDNYGGATFRHNFVLNAKQGKSLQFELDVLEAKFSKEKEELTKIYKEKLDNVLKKFNVKK